VTASGLSQLLSTDIVETLPIALVVFDGRLTVLGTNRAFERAFQIGPGGADGKSFTELSEGRWIAPELRAALARVLASGEAFEDFEATRESPREGRRILLLNARRLRRTDGGEPAALLILEDVTQRRAISDKLERSNQDLEQFAYVASHDLQEPLRMVVSYTQLLSRRYQGKLDSTADEFIAFAVDGAMRMQRLINDLLAYSRINRRRTNLAPIDSRQALADASVALTAAIQDGGAKIEAGSLPVVLADYGQLVQLFQNLIGNALKFRGAQSPVIRVTAAQEGAFQRFRVEDNGIGISPQYFEKVFIIFERLHGTDVPGTGIGLALCRKIVSRHGGRIWIEPVATGGAALCFTLAAAGKSKP
jgi:PAS domain S-box-containing protein